MIKKIFCSETQIFKKLSYLYIEESLNAYILKNVK